MGIEQGNAKEGDVTTLKSREFLFDTPSMVSFFVKMEVSPGDHTSKLNVHLMDPLGTVSKTIITVAQRTDSLWVKYYVSIPSGMYSLVFEVIHGWSHRMTIALDSVTIVEGTARPNSREVILDYDNLENEDDYSGSSPIDLAIDTFLENYSPNFEIPTVVKLSSLTGR